MSDYVKNALLDASPMKKQKEEAAALVGKWEKTGLLEGLNKDFEKSGMAVMLENQAKQLISEASSVNPTGTSDEEWSGVALPLVRRVFSNIVAQELVSVQPMNLPSGLVFYLDYKYGTTRGNATSGDSVFGKTGPNSPEGATGAFPDGGLYGAGKAGFTVSGSTKSVSFGGHVSNEATLAQINFDSDVSSSATNLLWYVTGSLGETDHDTTSVRSWDIVHSTPSNATVLQQFSTVDSSGNITLVVDSANVGNASGNYNVFYQKAPTATARGDFEDKEGNATNDYLNIPEIDLQLNSSAIVAKTRKLKAVWTPELAQDLNAYHSVDAEAELTSMLSDYISMEIDLEILDMLIADATTTDYWSAQVGKVYDSGTSAFVTNTSANSGAELAYTRFDWYQTLVEKIQKVSNTIHQLTLRGGANFVVVGPKVATILESIPGYAASTDGDSDQFAMGVTKIGAISGRFTVYKNPYITENIVLLGFRGSNFLETGAVYAPYVPLIMTPLVYDPSDFTPRKGVMTRYAKKMVRPEFYGKIYCSDLNLI
tara:strand:+ start:371 stop:1990 length:1620 start_codon:yes stop_codon:yes gene_type:complete